VLSVVCGAKGRTTSCHGSDEGHNIVEKVEHTGNADASGVTHLTPFDQLISLHYHRTGLRHRGIPSSTHTGNQ